MTILTGMNAEQCRVIEWPASPLLVAATAGSGKTRAIVHRIARLIALGVSPSRILALTFSTKAAREMTMRLASLGCTTARVGTFHSLALQIVREELTCGRWKVDDTDRYRIVVKDAISYKYMDWKSADVTHLLSFIARCKAAGALADPDDLKTCAIAAVIYKRKPTASREPNLSIQAYVAAEIIRRERQMLTFDDMLLEAWLLFSRDDSARVRWATRWDHVLQDEVQDENFVQHELAGQLARDHRSYTVVGDPAQAIYGFRGSDSSAMLKFESEWGAEVVRMGRNYRCAVGIVAVANKSLLAMTPGTHLGVPMIAERAVAGAVSVTEYSDFDAEGDGVTEAILESHEDGRPWKDHVVLMRTNAQSRGSEESFLSARIPYVVLGGTNFYDRREVKDLLAYLRVAAGVGSFDDVRRAINTPFRYLGKAFVDGLEQVVDRSGGQVLDAVREYVMGPGRLQGRQRTSALEWCQLISGISARIAAGEASPTASRDSRVELDAKPGLVLEALVTDLRYAEWLTRDEGQESPENNRVSNVRELVRAAGRFATVRVLLDYVDDTLERAARAKREATSADVVTLCSIHKSKGLEWPVVYVLGCNEMILPHAMAEDQDEERRLFYVACTRAADVLALSYVSKAAVSNRVLNLKPSHFLTEIGVLAVPEKLSLEAV